MTITPPAVQTLYLCLTPEDVADQAIPLQDRAYWPASRGHNIAVVSLTAPEQFVGQRTTAARLNLVTLGKNVAWNDAHTAVVAKVAGHISLEQNTLDVLDTLELADDLAPAAGHIHFPGTLNFHKSVLDSVRLSATGDIHIGGSIEAATVTTPATVTVLHGICGKERGEVRAHAVHARFASNARIHAAADVQIDNEINNSRVICGGAFASPAASVLSTHISAITGISCHTAGSAAHMKTILELSLDPDLVASIEKLLTELRGLQRISQRIRDAVQPLMQNPKALNAEQKETATDLLFQADEAEEKAREAERKLAGPRQRLAAARQAAIHVHDTLHAGVIIRFPGLESPIRDSLRGPLKITLNQSHGENAIVITDAHNHPLAKIAATQTAQFNLFKQFQTPAY